MENIVLKTYALNLTEDDFFNFCQENDSLRMERNASGEIIVSEPPTGDWGSRANIRITTQLENWSAKSGNGYAFDSNAGFTIPNGAVRAPDAAWIIKERFDALSPEDQEKFGHICPDFIIELRSGSDSIKDLRLKMEEWMENGCQLAWLIDPVEKNVSIYRKNGMRGEKTFKEKISGEEILPGFELDLSFMK